MSVKPMIRNILVDVHLSCWLVFLCITAPGWWFTITAVIGFTVFCVLTLLIFWAAYKSTAFWHKIFPNIPLYPAWYIVASMGFDAVVAGTLMYYGYFILGPLYLGACFCTMLMTGAKNFYETQVDKTAP